MGEVLRRGLNFGRPRPAEPTRLEKGLPSVHPCFVGPFVYRFAEQEDRTLSFVTGYGQTRWADRGSGDGSMIGARVGFHHKTLASFLEPFAKAGLIIRTVREFAKSGHEVLPWDIAVVTEKNLGQEPA